MKTKITALIAVLFISISASAQIDRSKQPKPGPAPAITLEIPGEFELKNGLKVLIVENHKLPRVSYSLTIDNQPITEGDKAGTSAMLGAMLGNGTTSITKDVFNEEIDFLGARLGFSSDGAYASGLSKYSDRILELMADAAINPLFSAEEFEKEKARVLEGLKNDKKSVDAVASRVGGALSYGSKHPYGEFITEETINNITLDNVRAFYQKYFNPNNAYLVIIGDVDFKTVEKQVKKNFKKWDEGIDFTTNLVTPNPNVASTQIDFVDMPNAVQSNVTLTNNVKLEMNNPDYHAVLIANKILGGGFSSYLNMNLREANGWTYGARSGIGTSRYGASRFTASTAVRNMVTDSTVIETLKEINRIKNEPVTAEALTNAKAKYVGDFVLALESPQTIARYALNIKLNKLPGDFYKTYLAKINAVTAADVQRVANKYFKPENARIIIIGKGSEVISGLEKTGIPIKYYDKFANPVAKPEFSKPIPDGVTAKSVLDSYITAIGGVNNINNVNTVKMDGDFVVQGAPALTVEIKKTKDNKESMEVAMQGMVMMKSKWNGTTGYGEQGGQKTTLSDTEITDKKSDLGMFPETKYDITNVTLESIVDIDGADSYKVKVMTGDDSSYRYYDVATNLLVQEESTSEAQGQKITTTVKYDNYSEVNGVKFPYAQTIIAGPQTMSMNIKIVKVNEGVTDADFN
ncbi:M16 family metallopeptidase [Psychroserpens sp. NJDZ02]|uniref:M16 family metallopeptidase n=1 Tax=Psychroserpens sp. NJDZ02 TaxID=2570561 RepID=UPI0010A76626|nr:pitrilysin family protein [Psychroserpens sp. NJDZ02]QCE40885.1 insulinase family protein [Psychroserpens sp. NJDZ02]